MGADTLREIARAAARRAFEESGSSINIDLIADSVVAAAMNHLNRETKSIEVGSILSARTKEGRVEITVGKESLQIDIAKAREIYGFLGGAIEAATTDQIVFAALTDVGISEQAAGAFLLELREKRQGSKGVVYAS